MKVNAITSLAGLLASAAMCLDAASASTSSSSSPSDRAWEMVQQMNITEKLVMLHGHKGIYIGNIRGNDRLNIPSINMHDGPQGFRTTMTTGQDGTSTAWPSALTVAAAWDEPLAHRWAASMASEFRQKGANVLLGPGIGIARVPNAGR